MQTDRRAAFDAERNRAGYGTCAITAQEIITSFHRRIYCTQNGGDCKTCSLANYGRDCHNFKIEIEEEK